MIWLSFAKQTRRLKKQVLALFDQAVKEKNQIF